MKITAQQKLDAIEHKYYNHAKWTPKKGDYYTLTRNYNGLELFQITEETETEFGIMLIWCEIDAFQEEPTFFPKDTFTELFGECRVHLPDFIFSTKE